MQRRDAMENASEAVWDVMEPTAAFHTKRTQRTSHETRAKDIMARQDSLQGDSLRGSSAVFTGRQSDAKGDVATICPGFAYPACMMMYWRVLG